MIILNLLVGMMIESFLKAKEQKGDLEYRAALIEVE